MSYITQSQLDALAEMANVTLLPVVKAAQTANLWGTANAWYSKCFGGPTPFAGLNPSDSLVDSDGTLVNPQPDYSFEPNILFNFIPSNAVYDSLGNYSLTLPTATEYNYIQGANDLTLNDPSGSTFEFYCSAANIFFRSGQTVNLTGIPSHPVTASLSRSPYNLLHEMNRLRGDLMALYFESYAVSGGTTLFQNPAMICSGPWIVGVNDPSTWKLTGTIWEGALDGLLNGTCIFSNVAFDFAAGDASSLTVNGYLQNGTTAAPVGLNRQASSVPGSSAPSLSIVTDQTGTLNLVYLWPLAGTIPPDTSGFTLTATPSTGVTWSIGTTTDFNGNPCAALVATISRTIAAGTSSQTFSIVCPSGTTINTFNPGSGVVWLEHYYASINFVTASTLTTVAAIHPTSAAKQVACAESGGNHSILTLDDLSTTQNSSPSTNLIARIYWQLSNTTLKGVWIAKTLPVPGINVFLDQDFPPYIGTTFIIGEDGNPVEVAVAANSKMDFTTDAPITSSMRQAAPIQLVIPPPDVTTIASVRSAKPSITTRPAKWLARRDTDFVPYDLGFNAEFGNYTPNAYTDQVAVPGSLSQYNVQVPLSATKVLIRIVKPGTIPGWNSGTFSYGSPLGVELDILVKKDGFPVLPSGYDFKKTDGTVTITGMSGSDGGTRYLASVLSTGFSFAINNPGTVAQSYDIYVEVDSGVPHRVYTPPVGECFSYCLDGTPGAYFGMQAVGRKVTNLGRFPKPIPQSGYCLFKARATRLPADNGNGIAITPASGTALTITLGQNIQNSDGSVTFTPLVVNGSNLTLTIPATSGTSDDVPIFIPVLSGNELVYQCSSQIILEAWANWQPLWFNIIYQHGQFPYDVSVSPGSANPPGLTTFQYALSFANDFNVTVVGWVSPYNSLNPENPNYGAINSAVVFPLFSELFTDIVAMLTALGGTFPSSGNFGGAGGSGAAGDNQGAGDASGGGFPAL